MGSDTLHLVKPLTLSAILLISTLAQAQTTPPDTIFVHGNILTGTHLRPNDTSPTPAKVQALAIANGKILATGTDTTILKLKGPKTKIIDLHGAFAMPGFNDAHTHMAAAGQQQLSINLDGVKSLAQMQQRIRIYAAKAKPGSWLQGGGWDHTLWPGAKLPTREDIDRSPPATPASSAG